MTQETSTSALQGDPRLGETPRLEAMLRALRAQLARKVLLHGVGTVLAVAIAWLLFAYLADRVLHVPHAVRVVHGAAFVGLCAFFTWRAIVRPLRSLPSRTGLAVLFERAHPELGERLVSAVQFQSGRPQTGAPELIRQVLGEADRLAAELAPKGFHEVLESSEPRARFLLGAGSLAAALALAAFHPLEARIFLDRMVGGATPWPRRTVLVVDVPMEGPGVQVDESDELISVRVARGSDVPVVVRAEGEVPEEVTLHFVGGRDLVLAPSGGRAFRTLLRSCQEDVSFHVTGSDDQDRVPRVEIEVLRPPDVAGIAFRVEPPAYSGLEDELVFQREVDVLAGSRVRIHVRPEPADARGSVLVLPEERTLELEAAPFPARDGGEPAAGAEPPETTAAPAPGLAFDWTAESSIGFRVELTDDSGLTNPEPGLFRVRVVEDRPPEVQILQPTRSEFEVVKGGAFPLRARGEDDFGVRTLDWSIRPAGGGEDAPPVASAGFETVKVASEEPRSRPAVVGHVRIEVDDLGSEADPVSVEERFEIEVAATDNREPEAGTGRSTRLRARVVTAEELLRRMQDRLAQTRLAALRLSDLQREKRQRVRELLEASEGDASGLKAESLALAAALGGQRRVAVDARSLSRELAAVTEDILYARVDEKAGPMLDFYDAAQEDVVDALFHAEPWRELAEAQRAGELGPGGFAANLVELVELSLGISEGVAADAAEALAGAERASGAADVRAALLEAEALQARSLERIDDLLVRLSEWDNFQNILALTRDILNRQKALKERTQQFASQK